MKLRKECYLKIMELCNPVLCCTYQPQQGVHSIGRAFGRLLDECQIEPAKVKKEVTESQQIVRNVVEGGRGEGMRDGGLAEDVQNEVQRK